MIDFLKTHLDTTMQLFLVIGTWVLAVAAIWGEKIKVYFRVNPKLVVKLVDPKGDPTKHGNKNLSARYYHLAVINENNAPEAKRVRLLITQFCRKRSDGSFLSNYIYTPLHLMWQFSEFKEPDLTIGYNDTICDLGYLVKGDPHFKFSLYYYPNSIDTRIRANDTVRIEVKAVAENAISESFFLEIAWNGKWEDDGDKMSNCLIIKEIDKI